MNKKDLIRRSFNLKAGILVIATTLIASVFSLLDVNTLLYQTNILDFPEHEPFDGTVYPVQKAPDFVHLSSEKWDLPFNQLQSNELIDIPRYEPEKLQISTDTLKWGNAEDDIIRNAKIIYSVPYLGTYLLDGKEGSGSHPAIDIKVPEGTPVLAIANGTVIKASTQSSGFGHHIVLQHNNFPSLEDANAKTVIYSSYSHLSEVLVDVGDVVKKGQQIALSGSTGTATTPHVHFQIDNDQAPWHPFWPFSWQEISNAGLDFFSAINTGFGQENAKKTTINPLKYVQTYLNTSSSETTNSYVENNPEIVSENNEVVSETEVVASNNEVVSDVPNEIDNPELTSDTTENQTNFTFSDVPQDDKYYEAISFLTSKGIIEGYNDGTFKPQQPVNRVEALKFILEGIKATLEQGNLPFSDVSLDQWYSSYLYTAYRLEIVNGHPDGTFKPNDTVNKAEFFKILFNGLKVDINPNVSEAPFADVQITDWFAHYLAYAKQLQILDPNLTYIDPAAGMTRGEVADAMYKLMKLVEVQ